VNKFFSRQVDRIFGAEYFKASFGGNESGWLDAGSGDDTDDNADNDDDDDNNDDDDDRPPIFFSHERKFWTKNLSSSLSFSLSHIHLLTLSSVLTLTDIE